MALHNEFKEFVELLNSNNVRYIVTGGYAVSFYGYPRYTGDIDVWIDRDSKNCVSVLDALVEFGFGSLNIGLEDLNTPNNVIQLGNPPLRIDILTSIDALDFSEAWETAVLENYGGVKVRFISKRDLIKNKRATGRYRDLDDIEHLEE